MKFEDSIKQFNQEIHSFNCQDKIIEINPITIIKVI
ncbi:unnamed protein product [Paramecium sonneborni]|uniref:Uncharacterized protein n=1 Tax=Paramecium sonneborni TaxID=65129 RepID=A0A8S1NA99_9CILI|nr:unnamed protein product [Paramecium sonneborni]